MQLVQEVVVGEVEHLSEEMIQQIVVWRGGYFLVDLVAHVALVDPEVAAAD